ncbi:hypothetical protein HPB49_019124 [Dermacentor silvarum]|uniref:Uncharacterized protein n=1 Tax=Dermacentor silvarum TaxID=543639 RepID=A0ACB8D7F7_DERSI|nr:hypothetical protein HPB49_019124 [Dermacentor silvarum]
MPGPPDSAATEPDLIGPDVVDDGPPSTDILDTTSLLRYQASTLRSLAIEPPSGSWERAMQVWCDSIKIVATTMKLPPAVPRVRSTLTTRGTPRVSIGANGGVPCDSSLTAPSDFAQSRKPPWRPISKLLGPRVRQHLHPSRADPCCR